MRHVRAGTVKKFDDIILISRSDTIHVNGGLMDRQSSTAHTVLAYNSDATSVKTFYFQIVLIT